MAKGQGVSLAEAAAQVFTFGKPGCMVDFEHAGPTTQRQKICFSVQLDFLDGKITIGPSCPALRAQRR